MARRKQPKQIHQMTIAQWEAAFPDEDHCDAYLVAHRWPDGVHCPRCGSTHVYKMTAQNWKWECLDCAPKGSAAYRFSDITGTVFENTNKDLRDWFRVIHLMLTAKKGVSALQVMRYMGFGSYKTAHYMCMRIRVALQDADFRKLLGIVEIDETFIGGKARNKHRNKRGNGGGGAFGSGMTPVAGAIERDGNVVARVVNNVRSGTLTAFVRQTISDKVSLIVSDDFRAYDKLRYSFPHETVNHSKGEYVVGALHTNTIEGFWSLVKRGIIGSHHKVSKKYLPLYVAEYQFRYNHRHNPDIFGAAIAGC